MGELVLPLMTVLVWAPPTFKMKIPPEKATAGQMYPSSCARMERNDDVVWKEFRPLPPPKKSLRRSKTKTMGSILWQPKSNQIWSCGSRLCSRSQHSFLLSHYIYERTEKHKNNYDSFYFHSNGAKWNQYLCASPAYSHAAAAAQAAEMGFAAFTNERKTATLTPAS